MSRLSPELLAQLTEYGIVERCDAPPRASNARHWSQQSLDEMGHKSMRFWLDVVDT
jgi:hypothetical protein